MTDIIDMINMAYLPDMVLILISGFACLYCGLLSRRLKKFNSLKTGVGASIVSLTQVIEDTHKAAKDAQVSTQDTVKALRQLLIQAESATPKVEALIVELERTITTASTEYRKLKASVDVSVKPAIVEAETTATRLMGVVAEINRYKIKVKPAGSDTRSKTGQNQPLIRAVDLPEKIAS